MPWILWKGEVQTKMLRSTGGQKIYSTPKYKVNSKWKTNKTKNCKKMHKRNLLLFIRSSQRTKWERGFNASSFKYMYVYEWIKRKTLSKYVPYSVRMFELCIHSGQIELKMVRTGLRDTRDTVVRIEWQKVN